MGRFSVVIELPDRTTSVIDTSVHIFANKDLRTFLREPFKEPLFSRLRFPAMPEMVSR